MCGSSAALQPAGQGRMGQGCEQYNRHGRPSMHMVLYKHGFMRLASKAFSCRRGCPSCRQHPAKLPWLRTSSCCSDCDALASRCTRGCAQVGAPTQFGRDCCTPTAVTP